MDTLTILPILNTAANPTTPDLGVELWVNEHLLISYEHNHVAVDLVALAQSLDADDEHFIITCGCGVPECGGIYDGVRVWREAGQVHWAIPAGGNGRVQAAQFVFEAEAYTQAIKQGLSQFMQFYTTHAEVETTPYLLKESIDEAVAKGWVTQWLAK